MTRPIAALVLLALAGCGLESDIGQDGRYRFFQGGDVDSALYPVRRMLWIEQDALGQRALLYYFSGELSQAELGIADLRRIAAGHGRFQMAFDTPLTRYLQASLEHPGRELSLRAGDASGFALHALSDEELGASGASRLLSSTENPDLPVAAYFGVFELGPALPRLELSVPGPDWVFEPALAPLELSVTEDADAFELEYGDASGADYLIVELAQPITEQGDGTVLDALVRTTLAPGAPYRVGMELLTDVAGKGCFSEERALRVRVIQVAREYVVGADGDAVVIHHHRDTLLLEPEIWTQWLDDPTPAAYCADYE